MHYLHVLIYSGSGDFRMTFHHPVFHAKIYYELPVSTAVCSIRTNTHLNRMIHRRLCRVKNMLAGPKVPQGLTPTTPVNSTVISPAKMSIGH
jgi:hypothetical protein